MKSNKIAEVNELCQLSFLYINKTEKMLIWLKNKFHKKKIIESELGRHNICKFSRDSILVTTFQWKNLKCFNSF